MNVLSKGTRAALCAVLVAAQVACNSTPLMTLTPPQSAAPTNTRPLIKIPTQTPTPGTTSTPRPMVQSTTLFPSEYPTSSPTISPTPFVPVKFKSIQMMELKTGWATADIGSEEATRILRTVDGGTTWNDVSPVEADFVGSFFLDGQTAWAWTWGREQAWRTLDGGRSWTTVGDFGWQPDLGFIDSMRGWKLNAEVWGLSFVQFDIISFSITLDGGQTWQETNPPPDWGVAFMAYPSAQMAWAVRAGFAKTIQGVPNLGVPFRIQATFDGGGTWTTRQMPLPAEASRVERSYEGTYLGGAGNCEFVSPVYSSTTIWKLALTCELQSWMYTSTNQGKTWIISDMPAGLDADVQFVDASTGWLLIGDPYENSEGHLYQTTDGGQSWTLLKRTGWADARLSFVDTQKGWALACTNAYCYQREAQQALIKTIDGGKTWQILKPQLAP